MKQGGKKERRDQRKRRVRAKISGTADRPRLAFFRSNKNVYAQIIDDGVQKTLMGTSSLKGQGKGALQQSEEIGGLVAKWASENGVQHVVFDRGGFPYTGSVKAFADAVRSGGVQF
ncbi:MAG: 50S ribosomal protein L18 [Candidatus Kaiserbacteria bacterium]|nr:50S ribosomal protein L18 [Candidatus Kaiserbacteria bacterium]